MGWANCGNDSDGRPIGYCHEAICDHPECDKKIHRGITYACGGMHGEVGVSVLDGDGTFWPTCERYFCIDHQIVIEAEFDGRHTCEGICLACYKEIEKHFSIDDNGRVGLFNHQYGGQKLPEVCPDCPG